MMLSWKQNLKTESKPKMNKNLGCIPCKRIKSLIFKKQIFLVGKVSIGDPSGQEGPLPLGFTSLFAF